MKSYYLSESHQKLLISGPAWNCTAVLFFIFSSQRNENRLEEFSKSHLLRLTMFSDISFKKKSDVFTFLHIEITTMFVDMKMWVAKKKIISIFLLRENKNISFIPSILRQCVCATGITCNTLLHFYGQWEAAHVLITAVIFSLYSPAGEKLSISGSWTWQKESKSRCCKTRVHLHQISLFTFASLSVSLLVCAGPPKASCLVGRGWIQGERVNS